VLALGSVFASSPAAMQDVISLDHASRAYPQVRHLVGGNGGVNRDGRLLCGFPRRMTPILPSKTVWLHERGGMRSVITLGDMEPVESAAQAA
jgi:hypothetical protein